MSTGWLKIFTLSGLLLLCGDWCAAAEPGLERQVRFDIPAQALTSALYAFSTQAKVQIVSKAADVSGARTAGVSGQLDIKQALTQLLKGTPFSFEVVDGTTVAIISKALRSELREEPRGQDTPGPTQAGPSDHVSASSVEKAPDEPMAGKRPVQLEEVLVTGSHIRGASTISPALVQTQQQMYDAGQSSLGDVIHALPQNYNGGQNPGVVMGSSRISDTNVNSTSSLNLRGLGPDATLTLINGHRVAYDSAVQSVDISAIPLVAVDRIEIVADGASALYGSDAVGGVANVILRPDYDGAYTSARVGTATEGRDFAQQYTAAVGKRWPAGGFIASGEFGRSTAVDASNRSFTSSLDPSTTLYPYQEYYHAVLAGHQDISSYLRVGFDGFYNERHTTIAVPLTGSGGYQAFGTLSTPRLRSFSVTPKLDLDLPGGWTASLTATYGQDNTRLSASFYLGGSVLQSYPGGYDNSLRVVELSLEGPQFRLPAGEVKAALGGGVRTDTQHNLLATVAGGQTAINTQYDSRRTVSYGYGEEYLPIVSAGMDIPGVRRLEFSGAARYESYSDIEAVTTPKVGVLYAPIEALQIRGSWGKSFKAPTLYQLHSGSFAALETPQYFGSAGYPAGSTVLIRQGGNENLQAERATTWTASLSWQPAALEGLRADASYFNIKYKNRIVQPVTRDDGALANPFYQHLIDFNPAPGVVDELVALSSGGLQNYSGLAYDPASVVAIVDERFQNAARQDIQGVDLQVQDRRELGELGSLTVSGLASYLDSTQELLAGQPTQELSGTIFNPPRWRARSGVTWAFAGFRVSPFLNYIGGLTDNRRQPSPRIHSMTTGDLTIRHVAEGNVGVLRNLDISLAIANIWDAGPPRIATSAVYVPPYDSTNYSALGRIISLTFARSW